MPFVVCNVRAFRDLANPEKIDSERQLPALWVQWQHHSGRRALCRQPGLDCAVGPIFSPEIVLKRLRQRAHTQLAGRWAPDVMGILSDAVETAFASTRELSNVHIIQADIYHLPWRPNGLCLLGGVATYLPDSARGLGPSLKGESRGNSAWVMR